MEIRKQQVKGVGALISESLTLDYKTEKGLVKFKNPVISKLLDKQKLWERFTYHYDVLGGRSFEKNPDVIKNIEVLFQYFLGDENFIHNPKVVSRLSMPSHEKGLLIIGPVGVGKTIYMKALSLALRDFGVPSFGVTSTNRVVQDFEICSKPNDKAYFLEQYCGGRIMFDDLGTERDASNFGVVNVVKEIFEERSLSRRLTFVTCNYMEGYEDDVEGALLYILERYGFRTYDRLFEMFNIIQFTGKSLRR